MLGSNMEPKWTPDGRHLLFIGTRAGSGLWSIEVRNGEAVGEPTLVRPGLQRGLLGVSASGTLYYLRASGNEYTTFVVDATQPEREVTHVFAGYKPALSPDGKHVAFLRYLAPRDGSRPRPFELTVRTLETGQERSYPHAGVERLTPIVWRADGTALIVAVAADGDGGRPGGSLYSVDLVSGRYTQLIARATPTTSRSSSGAFASDGKTAYMSVRRDGGSVARIIAVDLATGAERDVVVFPMPGVPAIRELDPVLAISPDGRFLALSTSESPKMSRLDVVTIETGEARELSGPWMPMPFAPARWFPDSSTLIAAISDTGGARLVRVPINGNAPEPFDLNLSRLTAKMPLPRFVPSSLAALSLSRDGSRLAFEATTVRTAELWALENVMAIVGKR
jgi:Tol biopolymer transport system component